jgi:hypothetical protein
LERHGKRELEVPDGMMMGTIRNFLLSILSLVTWLKALFTLSQDIFFSLSRLSSV